MIQAPLARVVEAFVLRQSTEQTLSTYVGRGAGRRVLQEISGAAIPEEISAIILFADLKRFTALSNTRPPHEVIETLNSFYDIAEGAIGRNGGEIL